MSPTAEKVLELHAQGVRRVDMAREAGCSRVYAWMVLKAAGYDLSVKGPPPAPQNVARKAPASPRQFSWEV